MREINSRVFVPELQRAGRVIERGETRCSHSVGLVPWYRVWLDEIAWPKNFVATLTWQGCEHEFTEEVRDDTVCEAHSSAV